MKNKDQVWQKRNFFLSSFVRMRISLTTEVHRCVDYLIQIDWQSPLGSLVDVDNEIEKMYRNFVNG